MIRKWLQVQRARKIRIETDAYLLHASLKIAGYFEARQRAHKFRNADQREAKHWQLVADRISILMDNGRGSMQP
jgi:hypothetical protein